MQCIISVIELVHSYRWKTTSPTVAASPFCFCFDVITGLLRFLFLSGVAVKVIVIKDECELSVWSEFRPPVMTTIVRVARGWIFTEPEKLVSSYRSRPTTTSIQTACDLPRKTAVNVCDCAYLTFECTVCIKHYFVVLTFKLIRPHFVFFFVSFLHWQSTVDYPANHVLITRGKK